MAGSLSKMWLISSNPRPDPRTSCICINNNWRAVVFRFHSFCGKAGKRPKDKRKIPLRKFSFLTTILWDSTHPTVVIVTKAHQKPSPLPLINDLGNSSGLYHVSLTKQNVKKKSYQCSSKTPYSVIMNVQDNLSGGGFVRERPKSISQFSSLSLFCFVSLGDTNLRFMNACTVNV